MEEWKRHSITQTFPACRTGWKGVWDAFKSAITKNPRLTVPKDFTFSCYAKGDIQLHMAQVYIGQPSNKPEDGK